MEVKFVAFKGKPEHHVSVKMNSILTLKLVEMANLFLETIFMEVSFKTVFVALKVLTNFSHLKLHLALISHQNSKS